MVTNELAPRALVIGASGDIGSCVSELLCSRGISVTGIDLKENLLIHQPNYSHIYLDMSLPESISQARNLTRDPPCSYVISVAGGVEAQELNKSGQADFAMESLEATYSSNFKTSLAAISITKSLVSVPVDRDISVTLCSSINAVGNYQYPIYSASKSAVESLVLSQAVPLGSRGARINAIRLGTVVTGTSLRLHGEARGEHYERLLKLTSLARFVTTREAAFAFVAAAVDMTGMTGVVIPVDAGQSIPGERT
jgi:NAD(P)-dependent dehydrogenase (short-subunit alcohol dehydrogenase family)